MPRRPLLLFIAAFGIAAQVQPDLQGIQTGGDEAQNSPIIRRATRVVNVNVVVTDHEGRPVRGLNKANFELFDDGRLQPITFFSTREDTGATRAVIPPLLPGEYSNDAYKFGLAEEGTTIILFDTLSTAYLSQAYVLGKIRIFLRQLQPEDRVGVYVLNQDGLKVVCPPDQPAAALLQAMQRYDEAHNRRESEAAPATQDSTGLAELDKFLRGRDVHEPMRRCECRDKFPIGCEDIFPITMAALQEIARSTAGLRGRKAVVWVTEHPPFSPLPRGEGNVLDLLHGAICGMDYDPDLIIEEPANLKALADSRRSGSPESGDSPSAVGTGREPTLDAVRDRGLASNDELDLLIRLFNQNGIALYAVSAEGLQTGRLFGPGDLHPGAPLKPQGMDAAAPLIPVPGANTQAVLGAVDAVANVESHQHMDEMAQRTGGRAYYDRNDLETGIRRALDDRKFGYDLAYYPDHDRWNGDWRKIEVKVNRPDVTVLARSGYYAFPEPKLLPPKARKQLLEEIAASPLEDTEIPVTVKLTPANSVAPSTIEARVYLSAQNLFASHQPDSWTSDFEVLFFQLTAKDKILDVTTQSVSLNFTQEKYSEALKRGIKTLENLALKPGAALLYVIVHDKLSDAVGSVRIPLDQYAAAHPN